MVTPKQYHETMEMQFEGDRHPAKYQPFRGHLVVNFEFGTRKGLVDRIARALETMLGVESIEIIEDD